MLEVNFLVYVYWTLHFTCSGQLSSEVRQVHHLSSQHGALDQELHLRKGRDTEA